MDAGIRIVIVSPPGRSRESLSALLRTLRPQELCLLDPAEQLAWQAELSRTVQVYPAQPAPNLALVDLVGLGREGDRVMASLRRRWPGLRILALVETLRLAGEPCQGADCVLHRSVSAGDLLAAVQQLAQSNTGRYQPGFAVQTGLNGGRK